MFCLTKNTIVIAQATVADFERIALGRELFQDEIVATALATACSILRTGPTVDIGDLSTGGGDVL